MGTHPIFESDFDCLTEMKEDDLAAAALEGLRQANLNFDPVLKRYFDPDLNLFYDPTDRSYFDKRSGKYYRKTEGGELIETHTDPAYDNKLLSEESDSENGT